MASPSDIPSPSLSYHEDDYFGKPASVVYVLPDMIAFDRVRQKSHGAFAAIPISKIKISGFESYLVEQWVWNRSIKTQIVTYTGDKTDMVVAYRLEIVNDPQRWPQAFRSYIDELNYSRHSFPAQSEYGSIFVTNVAQLEPSLSLVSIPGGNLPAVYTSYVVNHNLKKLGCGSRTATAIAIPSKPMEDKFRSAYHVSSRVSLNYAARELVCIVQTFLSYYGLLDASFCNGLFCDGTTLALSQWWRMVTEIKDCSDLLPQRPPGCNVSVTFESVLGLTLYIRMLFEFGGTNLLSPPKDPLDVRRFHVCVLRFQQVAKINRTKHQEGYLDHETLLKLFQWVTAAQEPSQNFTKDFTKVKNMVKNTVMDFTSVKAIQSFAGIQSSPSKELLRQVTNCQDFDQVTTLPLGKGLTYLLYGKGHPINLEHDTLAAMVHRIYLEADTDHSHSHSHSASSSESESPSMLPTHHASYSVASTDVFTSPTAHDDYRNDNPISPRIEKVPFEHPIDTKPIETDYFPEQDYDGIKFERRLHRRNSWPQVDSEANANTGSVTKALPTPPPLRKRSNSMSLVEESLQSGGTDLFEYNPSTGLITPEWLAVQYISLLRKYKQSMQHSAQLQKETPSSCMHMLNGVHMDRVDALFQQAKNTRGKVFARDHDVKEKLKSGLKLNARLKYELRLLLQKTKEVETSLKSLEDFKVSVLEKKIKDAADNFHVNVKEVQPVDAVEPTGLSWSNMLTHPYLLFVIIVCYLRTLWTVYVVNGRWPPKDRSQTVQAEFRKVCKGYRKLE